MTEPLQPNPYTLARERLAQALAGLPWPVHQTPPDTVAPPCLVVFPDRGRWIQSRGYVGLIVTVISVKTGPADNGLQRAEDMLHRARTALRAANLHPGETSGPSIATGDRLTCEIPVSIRTAAL